MKDYYTQTEVKRLEWIITKSSYSNLDELLRVWVLVDAVSVEQKRMNEGHFKGKSNTNCCVT